MHGLLEDGFKEWRAETEGLKDGIEEAGVAEVHEADHGCAGGSRGGRKGHSD
jgi:hypothetical protein